MTDFSANFTWETTLMTPCLVFCHQALPEKGKNFPEKGDKTFLSVDSPAIVSLHVDKFVYLDPLRGTSSSVSKQFLHILQLLPVSRQ